jgi:hypothetical protein
MVRSETKAGMFPPGVLLVTISHLTVPSACSVTRSTLQYSPRTPFSSSAASAVSSGPLRSIGIEMNVLEGVSTSAAAREREAYPVRCGSAVKCEVCRTVKTRGETGGGKV